LAEAWKSEEGEATAGRKQTGEDAGWKGLRVRECTQGNLI
jgi:hypothetical protein